MAVDQKETYKQPDLPKLYTIEVSPHTVLRSIVLIIDFYR